MSGPVGHHLQDAPNLQIAFNTHLATLYKTAVNYSSLGWNNHVPYQMLDILLYTHRQSCSNWTWHSIPIIHTDI